MSRMITQLQAITTATIESTQHVRAVARVRRGGVAHRFAALRQSVGIRLRNWRVGTSRIHAPMLNSRLTAFGGGIAVGAVLIWAFDLQPRTSTITAQQGLASADTAASLDVVGCMTQALGLSRQDLPRESGLRMVSAVAVTSRRGAWPPVPSRDFAERLPSTPPPKARAFSSMGSQSARHRLG